MMMPWVKWTAVKSGQPRLPLMAVTILGSPSWKMRAGRSVWHIQPSVCARAMRASSNGSSGQSGVISCQLVD